MKWLLTNESPLRAALIAEGETVVGGPQHYQAQARDADWLREAIAAAAATLPPGVDPVTWALQRGDHDEDDRLPNYYRLAPLLRDLRPDVLVLTPMLQPGSGFARGSVNQWKNRMLASGAVVGIAHDPGTYAAASSGQWRRCTAMVGDLTVYVTNDARTAARVAQNQRAAVWAPGMSAGPIVRAVQHAVGRQNYRADKSARPFA